MKRGFEWELWGGPMGILFVVLLVISFFAVPNSPGLDEPTSHYLDFYHQHRGAILTGSIIGLLAILPVLWFAAAQRNLLRRAEGEPGGLSLLAFVAAVGTAAVATISNAIPAAGALKVADYPDAGLVVRGLNDLANVVGSAIPIFVAVWAGAVTLVVARTKVLPDWLMWLGALASVTGVLGVLSIVNPRGGAGILGLLNLAVFAIWVLATSIVMTTSARASSAGAPQAAGTS